MWEVLTEDLPNELKLKVKVFYGRHGTEENTSEFELERFPFIANFDFKEFKVSLFFIKLILSTSYIIYVLNLQ